MEAGWRNGKYRDAPKHTAQAAWMTTGRDGGGHMEDAEGRMENKNAGNFVLGELWVEYVLWAKRLTETGVCLMYVESSICFFFSSFFW